MKKNNGLEFGDIVSIRAKLTRSYRWDGSSNLKEWTRWTFAHGNRETGILIGFRTLSDGEVIWGQRDEQTSYKPKKYFKAALVVTDERSKPVLCLLKDVMNDLEMGFPYER